MQVTFEIPGEPRGKGRPRFSMSHGYVRTYTDDKTAAYENLVKMAYKNAAQGNRFADDAPLAVDITAYYSIPKSASMKKQDLMRSGEIRPLKKVDIDNLVKVVLDSLNGIAYRDDVQVVECQVRKFYADDPKVLVEIDDRLSLVSEQPGAPKQEVLW